MDVAGDVASGRWRLHDQYFWLGQPEHHNRLNDHVYVYRGGAEDFEVSHRAHFHGAV